MSWKYLQREASDAGNGVEKLCMKWVNAFMIWIYLRDESWSDGGTSVLTTRISLFLI